MTNDKSDQSTVQAMRRYIDEQAHTIDRDVMRIDLHRLLDKVCEAHEAENARLRASLKDASEYICDKCIHGRNDKCRCIVVGYEKMLKESEG